MNGGAAALTTALLLRIEDSFFGSSAFAAALWIDTATVLVDKGLIMIIIMMASNKGGDPKSTKESFSIVLYLLHSTLTPPFCGYYKLYCKISFPFLCDLPIEECKESVSYTKKDKQQHDFFFIVVGQNVIEITTNINEVDMTHGKYL